MDGLFGRPSVFINQLDKKKVHTVEYTIGKFNPANLDIDLIKDAVSQALSLGAGAIIVHTGSREDVFSLDRTCSVCKRGFFKPDPEDLSFNSKRGACPACAGTGTGKKGGGCPSCKGSRLNPLGSNIRLADKNIHDTALLTAPALKKFLSSLKFDGRYSKVSDSVFNELISKIDALIDIGLDYLSLDRDCTTLSGGELQRLRLAAAMGSPLSGVMYIFDEPSAGLHPLDSLHILGKLNELKDNGNSVIIIEHDINCIMASEYVIDIGPGAGTHGGSVVYSGPIGRFLKAENSRTAEAVRKSMERRAPLTNGHHGPEKSALLTVVEAAKNNVVCEDLEIPLNKLVCFAGVSGAGKSSLVHGVISDTINMGKGDKSSWSLGGFRVKSDLPIERALFIDQKPIGINSRSTPASYLGIWDEIRKVFALTVEAKARGWSAGHFSYNTGKGRCPECKGQGQIKLEMSFLPDAYMLCEACGGSRYQDETNSIHYLGLSISDVLKLTFDEAKPVFANHKKIYHALHQACEIGLGYLTLGQSSATLSGGESQRIKLVSELSSPRKGHTLYILDEPTTGLHKVDVEKLVKILKSLVARGNTVFVIEHEEEIVFNADYLIELGPGPGEKGGKIIFEGSPDRLSGSRTPWGDIFRAGGLSLWQSGNTAENA